MKILLPETFDDAGALRVAPELMRATEVHDLTLDFSQVNYVYPFGTLLIAQSIRFVRHLRQRRGLVTRAIIPGTNGTAISYLKYFGFFKHIGYNVGHEVNEAPGGKRYIPISVVNANSLDDAGPNSVMQDEVVATSNRLASVIFSPTEEPSAVDMLSYCFREIMRNSFEHGNVEKCYALAQRWYNGYVEIAIADLGQGIFGSLGEVMSVENSVKAIELALRPGISSAAHLGDAEDRWANTGFGLYVVSELGARYGDFSIASSHAYVCPRSGARAEQAVAAPGTVVKLRIRTDDAEYWPNILANIVAEGEARAKREGAPIVRASGGSRSGSRG